MKHFVLQPEFGCWRDAARDALHAGYAPDELDLQDAVAPATLTLALEADEPARGTPIPRPHTSRAFLEIAALAAVHRDPGRWNLLYRVLYRMQGKRDLLQDEADPDVLALLRLAAQVRRDLQRMQAFVRFRKVLKPGEPTFPNAQARPVVLDEPLVATDPAEPEPHHLVLATPTPFGVTRSEVEQCEPLPVEVVLDSEEDCEHFIAWYQPEHRILALAAPFFAERFGILQWTILTPDACVSWDPTTKQMTFAPGLARETAPAEDELEGLWRSYYASIFNPARVIVGEGRPAAVSRDGQGDAPLLPRIEPTRAAAVVTRQQQGGAQPFVPEDRTLASLLAALPGCRGCELYCHATQVVGGRGKVGSPLLLVGEQPGDQEDVQGLPFVGPAGKILDRALEELGLDREAMYVTNAVKHFKFVQRGKLRLHQNPRMSEITACRPWLLAEIEAVRPKVVLCLGASASKSLLGASFSLMRERGKILETPFAKQVIATIHPSAVLRARDQAGHQELFAFLKEDLALAYKIATS